MSTESAPAGNEPQIVLFGAGKIGEALLAGLLSAGRNSDDVVFVEPSDERSAEVTRRYGVRAVDAEEAARTADLVVLAVKPPAVVPLLDGLDGLRDATLVVSLCAGVSTEAVQAHLPAGSPVVRVMPNTPMLVGEGMSAVSAGAHATEEHLALVEEMMRSVGRVVRVPESQQDAVTAISGSGPAYLFLVIEALVEAGVALGLPRPVATELATQTAVGAAHMARDSGEHPALLREAVTSPGGTTAAALAELEAHGLRTAFAVAARAARDRSVALGAPASTATTTPPTR